MLALFLFPNIKLQTKKHRKLTATNVKLVLTVLSDVVVDLFVSIQCTTIKREWKNVSHRNNFVLFFGIAHNNYHRVKSKLSNKLTASSTRSNNLIQISLKIASFCHMIFESGKLFYYESYIGLAVK